MSYGSALQEAGARRRPVAWFLWLLACSMGLGGIALSVAAGAHEQAWGSCSAPGLLGGVASAAAG